jgi:hypothetical protein
MAVPARFWRVGARILMDSMPPASAAAQRARYCQRSGHRAIVCLKYRRKRCLCFWQVPALGVRIFAGRSRAVPPVRRRNRGSTPLTFQALTGRVPVFTGNLQGRARIREQNQWSEPQKWGDNRRGPLGPLRLSRRVFHGCFTLPRSRLDDVSRPSLSRSPPRLLAHKCLRPARLSRPGAIPYDRHNTLFERAGQSFLRFSSVAHALSG